MSDEPKLDNDDAPSVPLYTEGDVVSHKASKQSAVILCARDVVIHDRSCQYVQPLAGLFNLPPCDCPITFNGEYVVSTSFAEETIVDECVLEAATGS